MLTTLAQLVLFAAGAASFAVLAWALTRNVVAGAALVLVLYLSEAVLVALPGFRAGILIYPQDVIFVLLGVSGLIRLSRRITLPQLLLLAYFALVLGSFARGVQRFGPQPAGTDVRTFVYLAAGVLYLSTFEIGPARQRTIARLLVYAGGVLLGLAVFRWIATALDLPIIAQWAPITTNPIRVLHSGHALFLSQCGLVALALNLERRGWERYLAGLLFGAVLLLQHRTVWLETLVVGVLALVFSGRLRGRLIMRVAGLGLLGAVFTFALFGARLQTLGESLHASATGEDTWTWRVRGWAILVQRFMGGDLVSKLVGAPFGSGYVRTIGFSRISVSPHNFYVHNLLRVGFIGLALFVAIYAILLVRVRTARVGPRQAWPRPGMLQLLLVSQLLYFITYAPGFEQCLFLGLALGYLRAAQRTRQPAVPPPPAAINPRQRSWAAPEPLASRP